MPEKLERCVADLKAQGKPEDSAWPICIDSTGEKPHSEESIEETVMREVLNASMNRSCKCQKNKKKPY